MRLIKFLSPNKHLTEEVMPFLPVTTYTHSKAKIVSLPLFLCNLNITILSIKKGSIKKGKKHNLKCEIYNSHLSTILHLKSAYENWDLIFFKTAIKMNFPKKLKLEKLYS